MKSAWRTASIGVFDDPQAAARFFAVGLRPGLPVSRRLVFFRRALREMHAQPGADQHQRREHIRRIADEGHIQVFELFAHRHVLDHGQHIADHLRGVVVIGQSVNDRHLGIPGQLGDCGVLQGARFDHIAHAREHFGSVIH